MFIYVSGPYSAKDPVSADDAAAQIRSNIARANEVGILLAKMGHTHLFLT